ncbi:hypothetical protein BS50DRAFT_577083 [Corynespora cassiicola Philippines]|uniref:Secreted protein n=1 Tax=Corynespora cassiicola Philippines TaxID=1448308 RepID=A0A2T2ND13_CORCC|nr:hypothetical protein BS50DRAFT_577083 [Corynespora cassiicola Philippines]
MILFEYFALIASFMACALGLAKSGGSIWIKSWIVDCNFVSHMLRCGVVSRRTRMNMMAETEPSCSFSV